MRWEGRERQDLSSRRVVLNERAHRHQAGSQRPIVRLIRGDVRGELPGDDLEFHFRIDLLGFLQFKQLLVQLIVAHAVLLLAIQRRKFGFLVELAVSAKHAARTPHKGHAVVAQALLCSGGLHGLSAGDLDAALVL